MKLQVIKGSNGEDTSVFITMRDWLRLKGIYPNIENADQELDQWEKDLIDKRLEAITDNPERLVSGDEFLNELKRKNS